jgi:hypothetical protein
LERACPGVSRDMIRLLLRELKFTGRIECLGRGPGAKWRKRVIPSKEGNKGGNKPSDSVTNWGVLLTVGAFCRLDGKKQHLQIREEFRSIFVQTSRCA